MHLTWTICHWDGREKGTLDRREGGEVTGGVMKQRFANVTAPLDDAARLIQPGRTRLKVHCHPIADDPGQFLLFNGLIQQPRALGKTVEIPAVCPSIRLLNSSPAPLPTDSPPPRSAWAPFEDEQSEVMWELVHRCDRRARELRDNGLDIPLLGIVKGDLANTRDSRAVKFADARTGWDSLLALAKREGAPDFDLVPLDRDDAVYAQFDTHYPRQGRDKRDDVVLEYGNNLSDFAYEPSGVDLCNQYVLVGKPSGSGGRAPVYVAEHRPSMAAHGVWQRIEQASDIGNMDELERKAKEYVSKHARMVNFVDVTPTVQVGGRARGWRRQADGSYMQVGGDREWGIPPAFGPPGSGLGFDYWQGDTITVRAKRQFRIYTDRDQPGPETDIHARVTEWAFREVDGAGNVVASHTLAPVIPQAEVTGYPASISTEVSSG